MIYQPIASSSAENWGWYRTKLVDETTVMVPGSEGWASNNSLVTDRIYPSSHTIGAVLQLEILREAQASGMGALCRNGWR